MNFSLIVPTYNAGVLWQNCIQAIKSQSLVPGRVLVIDSSSCDETNSKSLEAGFDVKVIGSALFDHGGTRMMAANMSLNYEFVIFMTQDAILADADSLKHILDPFHDEKVAAVCGRQLPRDVAKSIEAHARSYNYSSQSYVRSIGDVSRYGLKTAFLSNSFAAYRVSALVEVGGFPENVIFGEDMYVAAKLLKEGYKVAYAADACVYHSHAYSILQEFARYFDMGVFHACNPWVRQEFGGAEGEGIKFVISEVNYVMNHEYWRIPEVILRSIMRYTGFRLGLLEKRTPLWLNKFFAMNKGFFKE